MPHSSPNHREITLKVVYCGPGLSGKSTSLGYLHRALRPDARGQIVSVSTGIDRTLFFDFFPIASPRLRGNSLRVQLYTTSGEVRSESTTRGLLEHISGVVFVADSQRSREQENLQCLEGLRQSLIKLGLRLDEVPLVFSWNKRDLPGVLGPAELAACLNPEGLPAFETVATTGKGVFDGLKAITGLVLAEVTGRRKSGPSGTSKNSNDRRLSAAQKALAALKDGREPSEPIVLDPSLSGLLLAPASLRRDGVPQALPAVRELHEAAVPTYIKDRVASRPESTPDRGADAQDRPGQVATVLRPQDNGGNGARGGPLLSEQTQPRKRPPTWLHPLSPEAVEPPTGSRRDVWVSHLIPKSSLRDQLHDVEIDLATGHYAQAVRRASGVFTILCAPEMTREPAEGPAWGALTLGMPVDRYLRFRESVRNAEAGTATLEDGLFALFFLMDAVLRR